ncbi:MAG: FtsW/RodA/SpoVE family cell cycle protein [Crocinitomicaceae bacterium]|nr:FtsW/RodA/SpoVE family cell cycle protein [Crocinitomicaceae bacterium]
MIKYFAYLKGDRAIWVITLILLAFSLVSVYSFVPILVKIEGGSPFKYLFKHLIYVIIGFIAMFWLHRKDPLYFSRFARLIFYASVALLLFTFFFGTKVNDAGRWIRIPFVGLTFQSSDFAKLGLIVYLSRLLVKKKDKFDSWKEGFGPVMFPIIVICGLIFKDNFSTAFLLFCISFLVLFLGKFPISKMIATIAGGVALAALVVGLHLSLPQLNLLPRYETWVNRITNKLENDKDVTANAQAMNAELAIYNGKFFGQGVGDGKLKEYLPEAYADFYYSSFVEEFGSLSAIILVFLYSILLFRIIRIALKSDKLFETYLCIGIGILLLTQATVNMMVCTGIFPVTGQNMPLLAMGGSALIMTCVAIGMIQSIAYRQQKNNKIESEAS